MQQTQIIDQAVKTLAAGGLIIFPSETTYGAGVDATNQAAVDKLLAYKARREGKPLSIAVSSQVEAEKYVKLNSHAKSFYQKFLPGPYTIISEGRHKLAQGVESEFGTLGVRIPDYELLLKILRKFDKPITATSANASDKKRPYEIEDILNNISAKQRKLIDFMIDVGKLPTNEPSTIIDTTLSTPVVLRQGNINQKSKDRKFSVSTQVVLNSHSEAETKSIAGKICLQHWNQIKKTSLVIGLDGELGAGKTIFAKGVAEFLQIREPITSPTYTYVREYDFKRHGVVGKLFHLDAWKVESEADLKNLGFFDMLRANNVIVVEWWSQIERLLTSPPAPLLCVSIETDLRRGEQGVRFLKIKN